ncbi:dynein regulatory complex subunit 2 isoform X2 [Syngnathoides biaculeatus]|uniref:dynein regulatory complex subunit 2 isoform X2 n=1 Tax=Syngnathoides biaculeatus TaxID=300417 RepID=UPI002ADE13E7|nr:dynein regulatory complex subunit 2 isoform X2 [Syngnathoides biaculeatus]
MKRACLCVQVKVQKEEHNSRLNQAKISQAWRVVLRQARSQRLRDDIIILRQTFERQLEGLNDVIEVLATSLGPRDFRAATTVTASASRGSNPGPAPCVPASLFSGFLPHAQNTHRLANGCFVCLHVPRRWLATLRLSGDLEEAERQSCHVRRLHLHHVERLRTSLDEHVASMRRRWEGNLRDVCRGLAEESDKMASLHGGPEDATFAVSRRHRDVARDVHAVYGDIMAAHRVAQRQRVAALRRSDREKLEEKRRQEQEAERDCSPAQLFMCRNQRLLDDTCEDAARVRRLQAAVTTLRAKLSAFQTEAASEADALAAASAEVAAKTQSLRDDLREARQASRKRMSVLALRTDAAARKLKAVVAKGEKVLQAAAVCSKMQQATSSWPHGGDGERPGAARPPKTFPAVHQLTRRLNFSLLQRDALGERITELRRDNRRLRDLLRRRLDAVTLGGGPAFLAVDVAHVTSDEAGSGVATFCQ